MTTAPVLSQPAAVLWDMDGTIIDTEPIWLRAEHAMLQRYGLELTLEVERKLVGSGLTAAAELFRDLGVPLSVNDILQEWGDSVVRGIHETAPEWMPGALETLTALHQRGIPNVLVTMSLRRIVDAVFTRLPDGLFSAVVAGDEVAHEKPHPDPYLRGAAALGVDPRDCVAFEDSPTGIRAAVAAGAITIGIPNQVPLEGSPAHELWTTLAGVNLGTLTETWARHRADRDRSE